MMLDDDASPWHRRRRRAISQRNRATLDHIVAGLEHEGIQVDRPRPTVTRRGDGVDRSTTTIPSSTSGLRIQLVEHRDAEKAS